MRRVRLRDLAPRAHPMRRCTCCGLPVLSIRADSYCWSLRCLSSASGRTFPLDRRFGPIWTTHIIEFVQTPDGRQVLCGDRRPVG